MAYCTLSDLEKVIPEAELIRLTDDAGSGSVDAAVAAEAIDAAGELVDAYIGRQVRLPITGTVPPILGRIAADLAVYNLYLRVESAMPDKWAVRKKDAVAFLEKFNKGEITLGLEPPPEAPENRPLEVKVDARDKVFNEDFLEKF